ncbi:2-hydroxyacid dehydrogenase [Pusillimonas sp. ANT_WB101]|uniref:2-hydroxyacid dehydrogenase n=1 Tax=Pusillimonas sp. ANT_WB101 TaxID=2597356 RepID=UPI0011EE34A7|nr:2-hydroxyacid dehydrogenase [Pusillimonas sp. ANT_WB101]KAA0911458.1 2-hydroxyacid dehydrogenase [Pusillimonas sp. ANT_WB101]NYT79431.1 2-hydroxyacid dehydrogenase [Alcaligenaceae bacterium]
MTNKKPTLIQLAAIVHADTEAKLAKHYNVVQLKNGSDNDAAIAAVRDEAVVMVTSATQSTPADLIDQFPNLRAICSFGVGYDSIDVKHAQQKGIQVSNTPDVLDDCVADHAFGLLLATARNLGYADRYVRDNLWGSGTRFPLGVKVSHKKLGIVGLGRIGLAIAQRAAGFDMEIRYHNRKPRNDTKLGYEPSLHELAQWADFLVIATVGGPTTRGLIDAKVLKALGPKGILINISRGSVIDEAALVQALQDGVVGGAGLDVYEEEPKVPDALKTMDNVLLAPHIASATVETRIAMAELVFDNVDAYATTGKVKTPIPTL